MLQNVIVLEIEALSVVWLVRNFINYLYSHHSDVLLNVDYPTSFE